MNPTPPPDPTARVDQLHAEVTRIRRELMVLSLAVFLLAVLAALDRFSALMIRGTAPGVG